MRGQSRGDTKATIPFSTQEKPWWNGEHTSGPSQVSQQVYEENLWSHDDLLHRDLYVKGTWGENVIRRQPTSGLQRELQRGELDCILSLFQSKFLTGLVLQAQVHEGNGPW
jgi:hypothetical protein